MTYHRKQKTLTYRQVSGLVKSSRLYRASIISLELEDKSKHIVVGTSLLLV